MEASILIPVVALAASLLTLISGFGLGTLMLPVFALFFPVELAILLTAIVHVLNNMFKFGLLWRGVDKRTLLLFGVPGAFGAFFGARLMLSLSERAPLFQGLWHPVDPLDLTIAVLMLSFGIVELSKWSGTLSFSSEWMVPGGILSGFFGGLSGHQGALRSMFLLRSGLSKEAYIATGIAIALLVDFTRLPAYLSGGLLDAVFAQWPLLLATTLAAFVGAWWGKKLIPKITYRSVQLVVGTLMIAIAVMLGSGVL